MLHHIADRNGIILRRDALAHGLDDNYLARARRSGVIVRLRQGVYALTPAWREADAVGQHLLIAEGVLQLYDDQVALSHQSACLALGGPNWGLDLSSVHLTNLYGVGERRAARVVHHRGATRVGDLSRLGDRWITSAVRTALDTASLAGRDPAVCVLDWFLNSGGVTPAELEAGLLAKVEWPHSLDLLTKVRLSDPRSESVGETRTRLLCADRRLPIPELQHHVYDSSGRLVAITDFAWLEYGLLGEFDGRQKYLRLRRPGESIEQTVLREKRREDEIREITNCRMIRFDWGDVERPGATDARLRRALGRLAA